MEQVLKLSIPSSIISGSNWENLKHIELQPNLPVCLYKKECTCFYKRSKIKQSPQKLPIKQSLNNLVGRIKITPKQPRTIMIEI